MRLIYKTFLILILTASFSCSRVPTLGLKSHSYGDVPKNVILLQVPGLSHTHLAMIRFLQQDARKQSSFEKMACTGNMWAFNFFEIRPTLRDSLLSQITGEKNMSSTCKDYKSNPIWNEVGNKYTQKIILESQSVKDATLLESLKCQDNKFLDGATFLSMTRSSDEDSKKFHFQEKINIQPGVYFDKTCEGGNCFATFSENVKALFNSFEKERPKTIVLRNFEFYKFLKAGNILRAKEVLFELNSVLAFLQEWKEEKDDTLILVSSSNPIRIEFPARGKQWRQFEKNGKYTYFRKSDLWSPLYADGAGAEKFCGVLEESSLVDRLKWAPSERRLSFDIFDAL